MARTGRPSLYRPEYAGQAEKLCRLGATDAQLADFFEVDERTINRWKADKPEFCQSLKKGKLLADATIAESLYHRAKGYSHSAVKIFADPKSGAEKIVEYTEHYPPDTTACIFWLVNRQPDKWRRRREEPPPAIDWGEQLRREAEVMDRLFAEPAPNGTADEERGA